MERYRVVESLTFPEQYLDCPVELIAGALLYDRKRQSLVLQLKFGFLTNKDIRSIDISVSYTDRDTKREIGFTYNTIGNSNLGEFFGSGIPVLLDSQKAENIKAVVTSVSFVDGEIWRYNGEEPVVLVKQSELKTYLSEGLIRQYYIREDNKVFADLRKLRPVQNNGWWQCACGRANSDMSVTCKRCGIDREWVFLHTSKEYLEKELKEYYDKQEEKARLEAERKAESKAALRRDTINTLKVIGSIVAAVLAIYFIWAGITALWTNSVYNKAKTQMNQKNYDTAFKQCYKIAKAPISITEKSSTADKKVKELIESGVAVILQDCANGDISLDDAQPYIAIASKYLGDENANMGLEKIKNSKNGYSQGQNYQNNGNYIEAIKCYKTVIKTDSNYENAVKSIDECTKLVKDDTLAKLANYEQSGEYNAALDLISKTSGFFEENDVNLKEYKKKFVYQKTYAELKAQGDKAMRDGAYVRTGADLYDQPNGVSTRHTTGYWGNTKIFDYKITQKESASLSYLVLWYKVESMSEMYWIMESELSFG